MPLSSTRNETLVSSSFSRRSRRLRDVTYWPSLPGERRSVHGELHGDGRLIDGDVRQRRRIFDVGDGLADGDAFHAGHRDDVAEFGLGDVGALQPRERKQFRDLRFLDCAVELRDRHLFARAHGAVEYASDRQPAEIIAVIKVRHQYLQRSIGVSLGRRSGLHDGFKQRLQILAAACGQSKPCPPWRWCRGQENRADLPWHPGQ